MKDRIKALLIGGLKASEVASVVGCTPAYISQLLAEEDFKKEVEAGRILEAKEKTEEQHIEQRYQNLEHKLISAISEDLPNAEFGQKLRALDTVGRRLDERRKIRLPMVNPLPHAPSSTTYAIINIGLPAHAIPTPAPIVEMNEQREIVAIDNQALAPLSSTGVKSIFEQMLERKKLQRAALDQIEKKVLEEL